MHSCRHHGIPHLCTTSHPLQLLRSWHAMNLRTGVKKMPYISIVAGTWSLDDGASVDHGDDSNLTHTWCSSLSCCTLQVQASELSYAHLMAAKNTGIPSLSAVIIVPPHFGPTQRRAMLDAAELAGLDVLSLVHSHAAAALQYGIERDFTGRTDQQILLDIASTDAIAALVTYSSYNVSTSPKPLSQFKVEDITWREGGGTNQLDNLLMRHFANEFEAKTGEKDVLANGKTAAKLRKAVRRTKEMLTPNVDAPLHVEELHNGIDFASSITRDAMEQLAGAPHLLLMAKLGARHANMLMHGCSASATPRHTCCNAFCDSCDTRLPRQAILCMLYVVACNLLRAPHLASTLLVVCRTLLEGSQRAVSRAARTQQAGRREAVDGAAAWRRLACATRS